MIAATRSAFGLGGLVVQTPNVSAWYLPAQLDTISVDVSVALLKRHGKPLLRGIQEFAPGPVIPDRFAQGRSLHLHYQPPKAKRRSEVSIMRLLSGV